MFYFAENLVGLNFSHRTACSHCASLRGSFSGKLKNKCDLVENNRLNTTKFTITSLTFTYGTSLLSQEAFHSCCKRHNNILPFCDDTSLKYYLKIKKTLKLQDSLI